jgi:adenylate kinase
MSDQPLNILLLGPPGSGKGTQASLMSEEFDVPHISTGDILRKAVADGTELGKEASSYMNKGELVPDKLVVDIVNERIQESDAKNGFILDGFPRTIFQAEALDEAINKQGMYISAVIDISVNEKELVKRLTARRVCEDCTKVYHLIFEPPENDDYCDLCGGKLIQREDDKIETVQNRLEVYRKQTEPLIDYYKEKKLLRSVDGEQTVEQVFYDIVTVLKGDYA